MIQKSNKLFLHAALLGGILLLSPAIVLAENWANLPPDQQQLLAPLAATWNKLETAEQKSFIGVAKAYPQLPAEKQQRLREQIASWAALTPAQRHQAREKFTAFSKVPAEKREAVKQMVREQEAKPDAR